MEFKDIERVNSELKMTSIKGKAYAEVPQRVQAFRKLYPEGFIITEMMSNDGDVCVIKATAGYYTENHEPVTLATGIAYEDRRNGPVNKTSHIENCETSAIGRCLGFIGLGSETSIASAEEVSNAIEIQERMEKAEKKAVSKVVVTTTDKVPNSIPEFDPLEAIKAFCTKHKLTSAQLNGMKEAMVKSKIVEDIPYAEMTLDQTTILLSAIQRNFPKEMKVS